MSQPERPAGRVFVESASAPYPSQDESEDLERLARLMDDVFHIPGVGVRFGLDVLIGLIPGVGDMIATAISLHILNTAHRQGVPRIAILRMATNIGIDLAIGAIPVLGDVFDLYWKSNLRNIKLLRKYEHSTIKGRRRQAWHDWLFIGGVIGGVLVVLVAVLVLSFQVLAYLWRWASGG